MTVIATTNRVIAKIMSDEVRARLYRNLEAIRERIAAACRRAGRSPDDVTLVAVTKYAELAWVQELVTLGCLELGEARPQKLVSRAKQFPQTLRWHLIGHLQRNKADAILPLANLIHSVDSIRLFDHLAQLSRNLLVRPKILLEVNVSGEASKDGFDRDSLLAAWSQLQPCDSLEIAGLMTMAPHDQQAESARGVFRQLRELRDELRGMVAHGPTLRELSMGMSGDFEVAIEEGATMIRLGSVLFEGLTSSELGPTPA